MTKKDDYIYSYVDKQMVDTKEGPKFDSERHKKKKKSVIIAIIVGALLGLLVLGIIIIKGIVKDTLSSDVFKNIKNALPYTRNELVEDMDNFLNTGRSIGVETNNIIEEISISYSNNDFSNATKSTIEKSLEEVKKDDLDSYTDKEYQNLKIKFERHITITEEFFSYYKGLNSQSNEALDYLSKLIKEKNNYIDSYTEDVKSTLINAGLEYEILEDGSIRYR